MEDTKHTSTTDKPIASSQMDKLKGKRYAQTLADFIMRSDTPLTIGLQGEWGTGKTSMMYMIQELLKQKNVATSWVNTWEYSIFRGANETTPAILKGMLEKLKQSCIDEKKWTLKDDSEEKIKRVGRFLGKIANQVVANQTGVNIEEAITADGGAPVASAIAYLKEQISDIINTLLDDTGNEYSRVVFFVDDLDRIPPNDAVEVLEALKNIFDTPRCIYVLAIDYEVVVKGLEGKFGKKTPENEREFRSFFDKIIQVPFSMPTAAYDISEFLGDKFEQLGIDIPSKDLEHYLSIVKNTVGFNPRSLKRYLNSYSLLRSLREIEEEMAGDYDNDAHNDLALFALLGIQISYPSIFRIVMKNPFFWTWTNGFAKKLDVDLDKVREMVAVFEDELKDKTDEIWEKTIYGFCHKHTSSGLPNEYLKSRWDATIDIFNLLRDVLVKDYAKKKDKASFEALENAISNSISFAAITNVDDDVESKVEQKKRDTSRYNFEGKPNLTKGRLAFEIIKRYVEQHPNIDFARLEAVFNKETCGVRDVIMVFEEAATRLNKKQKLDIRHFVKTDDDRIKLTDCDVAVSTQWGQSNIDKIIAIGKTEGFKISN